MNTIKYEILQTLLSNINKFVELLKRASIAHVLSILFQKSCIAMVIKEICSKYIKNIAVRALN